ncbi:ABC transporter substrate-binding protein [Chitinibacter tainanensis]|uniref:ABC transporter substrate-binding protein n=1 Tax=Chitinibacter tainanensis TaxID=230667 RepID=UPI002352B985|nr:ABC transporter substrate-binding protein [Chitinibacter tainanensis]
MLRFFFLFVCSGKLAAMGRAALQRVMLALCLLIGSGVAGAQPQVFFINPGHADEAFWRTSSAAMQAAARQLGFDLQVSYAGRDPLRALEIARLLAARPRDTQPDFILLSNDFGIAPDLLGLLAGTRSRFFLVYSAPDRPEEIARVGRARERISHWLGSLVPDAEMAGYQTASRLIQLGRASGLRASNGKLQLLAIAGDRATTSSILRTRGMQRAIAAHPDAQLVQLVYGKWSRAKAREQSQWLFERHPEARLIWAGSDQMAFGAMDSLRAREGVPGQDALFTAINTSPAALAAVQSGELSALAGGHFMAGAWSLVVLYDYLHGRDFAHDEGLTLQQPMFALLTPARAARLMRQFGQDDFSSIDFRRYSKVLNPKVRHYEFTLPSWLGS